MIRFAAAALSLSCAATVAAQEERYEERWVRLADAWTAAAATDAGSAWQTEFERAHPTVQADAERRCGRAGAAAGFNSFQAVLVIGRDGRVEEVLPMPPSSHFRCFERFLRGQRYPAPPSQPWQVQVEFALERR